LEAESLYRSKLLLLATLLVLLGCQPDQDSQTSNQTTSIDEQPTPTLVITAIPDENVSDQQIKFAALESYLQESLDIQTEFSISKDYAAAVQRFKNGEVHLVWFGGLTGVQARTAVPGARAIAQGAADPNYKSYFIAHESTGLSLSDTFPGEAIQDLTFSFGSPSSTSGRLMPTYFIREATGKMPEAFFSKPVQFQDQGGHVATAKAVESGAVQVGAMNFKTYDSLVADGKLDPTKAPIIWVTPPYADYNLTAHPALDELFGEDFIDRLQATLVACEDPQVLYAFNREDLIPAKNADFDGILAVAKDVGLMR
ncbi:MAG: putative selenate ABC transporter substrate-binding protein, partial [Pseudomonadota bacterium]